MTVIVRAVRQVRHWWPTRADGLPPGQRALDAFPRFADDPRRTPPLVPGSTLRLVTPDRDEVRLPLDDLRMAAPVVSTVSDFHCVTTWTARGLTWTGVPLAALWIARLGTLPRQRFAVVNAADGYRAVFSTDDLFAGDVMLAWALDGHDLDQRHGAPLRLVSPSQYGYKNVKHVDSIEVVDERPASALGPKEHLRARVALEERHSRIHARLLRWPYRVVVPITAIVAERTLRRAPTAST